MERKALAFILASSLAPETTGDVPLGAGRAARVNVTEGNYRGQGDPVGTATLMIPADRK